MKVSRRPGRLLADRDVRLVFSTRLLSEIGSRITREGLPVTAVLVVGAGAAQMGVLAALPVIPALLLGPVAGWWLDRTRRRPVMVAVDLARAALLLLIPLAWFFGHLGYLDILLVTALVSGLATVFLVADQAYLPFLVGYERLEEGGGLWGTADGVGETVGPALMGVLVQTLGAPLAILLDALSYLVSAVGLSLVRRREPPPRADGSSRFRKEVVRGLRWAWSHPLLRTIVVVAAVEGLFGGIFSALYELFVLRVCRLSPLDLGLLVTSGGVGALLAAQFAPGLMRRVRVGPLLFWAFVAADVVNVLIPLAPSRIHPVAMLCLFGAQFIGDGAGTLYLMEMTVIQQRVVDGTHLGRVGAAIRVVTQAAGALGALGAGFAAASVGVRTLFWVMPVGTAIAILCLRGKAFWALPAAPALMVDV